MEFSFYRQVQKKGCSLFVKMSALILVTLCVALSVTVTMAQNAYGYTAVRATVTVKSGKVRKTPSQKGQFVFGVIKDETVTVIGEEKGDDGKTWYKIKVLGSVGYIRSDLIKKSNIEVKSESTPDENNNPSGNSGTSGDANSAGNSATNSGTAGPQVKGSNVICREEASTKSGIRIVLQNGQPLTIISTEKGKDDGKEWHFVSFRKNDKDYKGYIRSDLVNMSGTAQSSGADSSGNASSDGTKEPQIGKIKGTGVNIRKAPVDGKIICRLTTGNQITVTDQLRSDADGQIWYAISFLNNKKPENGYVRSDLTEGITPYESLTKTEEPKEESTGNTAEEPKQPESSASIKGMGVRIREKVVNGNIVAQLDTGYPIEVLEEVNADDGFKWYRIKFSKNDKEKEGYVRSDLVTIVNTNYNTQSSDADFEEQIKEFPDDYKAQLRALHEKYPNWQFEAVKTGLEWSDVVKNESKVGRNLVAKTSIASWKSTEPQAYNWASNTWYGFDGGSWAAASTELIQYYLDPRNFLDDSGIFQFETLEFKDYQNVDGVKNALAGTFMAGDYSDTDGETRSYASTFFEAGQNYGINPYHLASRAVQEQGVLGRIQSIAGNVSGLENLFNYFNIGAFAANGNSATINGLYYAAGADENYLRPWNSRYKSINGSAKYIADKYVSVGQNTLYFQKFNVVNSKNGIYSHQYMSNIVAASYESARLKKAYSDLNTKLIFRIPVYNNMPSAKCVKPTSDSNPNTYLSKLWVDGYSFTTEFSSVNSTYYLTVGSDVESVNIGAEAVSSSSSVGGTGTYTLNSGENRIQVVCKAQNGATKGYTIVISK